MCSRSEDPQLQQERVQYEAVETNSFSWTKVLVESFVEEPSRLCAVVRKTRSLGTKQWKELFEAKVLVESL